MSPLTNETQWFLRRAISVTVFVVLLAALLVLWPVLVLLALGYDITRPVRRWGGLRLFACLNIYGLMEALGLTAALLLWVLRPLTPRRRYIASHYRLQTWWASSLLAGLAGLYRLRFEVEGLETVADGPYLLLMRHTSLGDTLLPIRLLASPLGMRFRYVMKESLRWEPCLDIVGGRLPNVFVDRDSSDSAAQAKNVAKLGAELGPKDAVLLFPEGKRFTPGRRARNIDRLRGDGSDEAAACAQRLKHVLPAKRGGVKALLHMHPELDVVFCGHHGFDGATRLPDLLSGELIGRTVTVSFWRESAEAREAMPFDTWLADRWETVDEWVDAAVSDEASARDATVTDLETEVSAPVAQGNSVPWS